MDKMNFSKLLKDKRVIVGIIGLVVAAAIFAIWITGTGVSVEVSDSNADGISPNAEFVVKTNSKTTVDEFYKKISFDPKVNFELTQTDPQTFVVKPFKPLEPNSDIKLKISGKTFTYKVRNTILVTSMFPMDGGTKVPIGSGIEFSLNCADISEETFKQAVKIEPGGTLNFRAQDAGNGRFALYPENPMQYETKYTVTLSDTLVSKSGAKLEKPITFSFTTISKFEAETEYLFNISGNTIMNSLTSEVPAVPLYLSEGVATQDVNVKIFRFADDKAYTDEAVKNLSSQNYKYSAIDIDTKVLSEYADFTAKPINMVQNDSGYNNSQFLVQFPEKLPEGFYAVEFSIMFDEKPVIRQMFLQVSDLSVFFMNSANNMLLWVNDASTGKPVEGATLEVNDEYKVTATTGADGTAYTDTGIFNQDQENIYRKNTVFTVKAGDKTFVDFSYFSQFESAEVQKQKIANKYMSYLFIDRPIYHTTDTIHAWGVIIPRDEATAMPKTAILDFSNGMIKQETVIKEDGTFQADIKIEDFGMDYNYVGINLEIDEDIALSYANFMVQDFVKPVYTAETSAEKPVYLMNEGKTANVSFDVSTFDGTPVSEFKTNLESWDDRVVVPNGQGLETDASGHISSRVDVTDNISTWYPQGYTYRFANDDAESENFSRSGTIYAIHRDVMIKGKPDITGEKAKIEVTTNKIDISKIKTNDDLWAKDALTGEAITANVTAKLHKIYYTKGVSGKYYDAINRETRESYEYKRHDDVVSVTNIITNGGKATINDLPKSDEDNCYYMELITKDSKGNDTITTVYMGSMFYRNGGVNDGQHRYLLNKKAGITGGKTEENGGNIYYSDMNELRSKFVDGENVTFVLEDNDEPIKEMKGKVLYAVVQDSFKNITLTENAEITLPYDESLVPNYVVTGAYFDGKHVFSLDDKAMKYNPEQRELEVTLETDKKQYKPADDLTVTATVKNKLTGLPMENANVVISVVDEAIFALEEQYINVIGDLYGSIYSPNLKKYTSYNQISYGGAGEKGGGGNGIEQVRKDFKDTAHFSVIKTNKDGKAIFSMKLPDNITSWRLTSVAVGEKDNKVGGGQTKINTAATKDYFVIPIVNETLLEGDSVTVGLRGSGIGVTAKDSVKYTVTVSGEGVSETKEITSALREYAGLQFKPLKKGNYKALIKGECKGYVDIMELPFEVVSSGVEISLVKSFELKNGIDVEPLRYPISIAVYDKAYTTYNEVFNSLIWQSYGSRADMRLARKFVAEQYEKNGMKWYGTDDTAIGDINNDLIRVFPYSEIDIEITAKARLAVPEMVNENGVKNIVKYKDQGNEGAKSALYLAEALSGEKTKNDYDEILKTDTSLNYVDKMYLATALAVKGDTKVAKTYYDSLVKANLKEAQGLEGTKVYYVEKQGDCSSEACTAAASMLATTLRTEEMDGLVIYLSKSSPKLEPYILERLYYANTFKPTENSKAKFSYVLDGKTITEDLGTGVKYITLSKEQYKNADFKVISGDVYADVHYKGSPEQAADVSKKLIGFTKEVEAVNSDKIKRGDLVKITLTPDLSKLEANIDNGSIVINDYIPSGMKFEEYFGKDNEGYGKNWYFDNRQGQRLQFTAYLTNQEISPIVYYARCSAVGEYIVESAYISSVYSDTWGATERTKVKIDE